MKDKVANFEKHLLAKQLKMWYAASGIPLSGEEALEIAEEQLAGKTTPMQLMAGIMDDYIELGETVVQEWPVYGNPWGLSDKGKENDNEN